MVVRRRLDIGGKAIAFLTTTVVEWKPILIRKPIPEIIRVQLFETAEYYNARIIAYVIMPSHVHFLIDFDKIDIMPKFMWSFKTLTSRKIKETANQDFIREYTNKGKFHNNPVKGKLAEAAEDWEFSSARDWIGKENDRFPVYRDLL